MILRRAILIIIGSLIGMIAAEVILRTGLFPNPQYDRMTLHGEKKNSERRLLILGDSFIDSDGELSGLLDQKMKTEKTAFLNTAVGGMGPFEYLTELRMFAAGFKPDIVMLSYYVGNDLTDMQYYPYKSQPHGVDKLKKTLRLFIRQSYLYHLVKHANEEISYSFYLMAKRNGCADGVDQMFLSEETLNFNHFDGAKKHPDYLKDNLLMETPDNKIAWRHVAKIMGEIKKKCDEIGAKLLIVIFPNTLQVSNQHEHLYGDIFGYHLDSRIAGSRTPQDLLLKYCETNKIDCLDLLPIFKNQQGSLYLPFDDHLNARGNELSAEAITDFFKPHLRK